MEFKPYKVKHYNIIRHEHHGNLMPRVSSVDLYTDTKKADERLKNLRKYEDAHITYYQIEYEITVLP